ncbi:MAG: DUF5696 domain-containing protein [Thermoguttaceae bacterium]|jgi:hypothetical protein
MTNNLFGARFAPFRRVGCLVLALVASTLLNVSTSWAFTCHRETRGPLTFEISKTDPITVEGQIYHTPLIIENQSDSKITIKLNFSSIDSFYLYDESSDPAREIEAPNALEKEIVVEPQSTYQGEVAFAVRDAYLDAHYPIRARFEYTVDGKEELVELRPVFATKLTELLPSSSAMSVLSFKDRPYLKLNGSRDQSYLPYWKQDKGEYTVLPVNWSGSVPEVQGGLNPTSMTRSGVERTSWSVHPPYNGGPGVIGARYAIEIPKAKYVSLRFYSAMRDVYPPEPPTDGVDFRVYAAPLSLDADGSVSAETLANATREAPDAKDRIFADQYAGTEWKENNVDLSKFAGQTILLTLEADPGAKRDTTCDNSFWGDVAILAADAPFGDVASADEREALRENNLKAFADFVKSSPKNVPSSGVALDAGARGFDLDYGQYAVVTPGSMGVFDGWITIGSVDNFVQIDGIRVQYQGARVGFEPPYEQCVALTKFVDAKALEGEARLFARIHGEEILGDIPVDAHLDEFPMIKVAPSDRNELLCLVTKTVGGLAFRVVGARNAEITSVQFGPFTEKAKRVYFGHGVCIENPSKAFQQSGDGFGCSTSHIGLDFTNGLSLLEATTRPVNKFIVDPDLQIYTIATTCDTRLTLRSSDKGAFDCAIKYSPGFDKAPAPLVPKKAGRFVFDYWGGSYASVLNRMKTYVNYGLTNSMLLQHVWQHYGYDVRLPDIWPPRTEQGSFEELLETQKYLDEHGIPFGLHDNYIDFYPDADGFTYDDILFEANGQPQKAWYNPGPDVQSYRFNPTKFMPYAERNLNLIREYLMQTAYFTDVFSSIHIMDFYDREGVFHPRTETLDAWNRYFDLVRERFNNNAITVSESGSDALIGHLDGADAIFRRITDVQESFSAVIPCDDSEFVPWSDVVNHKRFILHGAGYSDRFQAGESRGVRGIESDDYITVEVLSGHAIMSDLAMSDRGTVRKYWLLQNLAESLALDEIVDFEFVDDDIHRQKITWKSGVVVYVNRSASDWTLDFNIPDTDQPVVLPRYGFWTMDNSSYGGVIRVNDQVAELRVDDENFFVNGRQMVSDSVSPIRGTFEDVEVVDSNTLEGKFIWNAVEPTETPYSVFMHIERPQTWWADKPELYVVPLPQQAKPTTEWEGREAELFGETLSVKIPEELPSGYYNLLCGLYDSQRRLPLLGSSTKDRRYRLGGIHIEGAGANRKLTFTPAPSLLGVDERLVPNKKSTNFGVCDTTGAFRFEKKSDSTVTLTPLPNEPAFSVKLATPFFASGKFDVVARDAEGKALAQGMATATNNSLTLILDSGKAFTYEITKQ